MDGRFITLDGIEGAGKSTQIRFIQSLLTDAGIDTVMTREPGGTAIAEAIRELLLHRADALDAAETLCPDVELLLMFAARAQHWVRRIRPALANGQWVVCDRFTDATYAYQGGGRGIDAERIAQLERWVLGQQRPDLTLILDLSPEQGLRRAAATGSTDRFERERVAFFDRARACYLARAANNPTRYRVIDAARPLADVQAAIEAALNPLLAAWLRP